MLINAAVIEPTGGSATIHELSSFVMGMGVSGLSNFGIVGEAHPKVMFDDNKINAPNNSQFEKSDMRKDMLTYHFQYSGKQITK